MKRSPRLDRYRRFVGNELLDQIYHAAASLAELQVLHINTTAQGGGVAELLHALLPVMDELGIKHTWKVVPLDDVSNRFEAHLVDLCKELNMGRYLRKIKMCFLIPYAVPRSYVMKKKIRLISISSMTSSLLPWRHYFPG